MALSLSNTLSDAIIANFGSLFADGWIVLRTSSNTVLMNGRLPLSPFSNTANAGVMAISGAWYGSAIANGVAANFIMSNYSNTYTMSGTVSNTSGTGDIKLANTTLQFGQLVDITSGTLTFIY